ncbi:MAG: GNAT family N-acetyltransferase [Verrucomicrobia bacterium]|nr:GNAT family N-acetyltransferase [Verrucomicrobiota bacterium]
MVIQTSFELLSLCSEDLPVFKRDMQEAFQKGAEVEFPDLKAEILPESHIDKSLRSKGAVAYKAIVDGQMAGGAVVAIDEGGRRGHLDFLYVRYGLQGKGIGQKIWQAIEKNYPDVVVWETATPYFEKRNIHFYINLCGFSAVEFFNPHHKDPHFLNDMEGGDYFFRFEKKMKQKYVSKK